MIFDWLMNLSALCKKIVVFYFWQEREINRKAFALGDTKQDPPKPEPENNHQIAGLSNNGDISKIAGRAIMGGLKQLFKIIDFAVYKPAIIIFLR